MKQYRRAALLAASAFAIVAGAAAPARATRVATVRVVLHPRGVTAPATYVDIDVRGTEVPIRLVRRVAGTCAVATAGLAADVLVQVACTTPAGDAVTFQVANERGEILVRRTPPPGATADGGGGDTPDAAAPAGLLVISRSHLPPDTVVRVR